MKKHLSSIQMVTVAVTAMLALIVAFAAGTRLSAPDLPSIGKNVTLNSIDVQQSEAPAASSAALEGTQTFRTVVTNPATGAQLFEWQAPTKSSQETAVTEDQTRFHTVVTNPETGARIFEWQAPTKSSQETADTEDQTRFHTVVTNPETGARVFEWQAPTAINTAVAEASKAR